MNPDLIHVDQVRSPIMTICTPIEL